MVDEDNQGRLWSVIKTDGENQDRLWTVIKIDRGDQDRLVQCDHGI